MTKNNSIQPENNYERSEIGITKNKNTDVLFSDYPDNLLPFDNMLQFKPYQSLTNLTTSKRNNTLTAVLTDTIWQQDFQQPVLAIMNEANDKRLQLHNLLITNPYFPWHKKRIHFLSSCYYRCLISCAEVPVCGGLLEGFFSIVLGFPLFLISLFVYMIWYVMDCFSCRLQVCRGNTVEKAFYAHIIEQHPQFDTNEIDTVIKSNFLELSKRLSVKYPTLSISIKLGQQQIVDEKNADFYMQDYFILIIEKNSSINTTDDATVDIV
jgi:hypothetical protein